MPDRIWVGIKKKSLIFVLQDYSNEEKKKSFHKETKLVPIEETDYNQKGGKLKRKSPFSVGKVNRFRSTRSHDIGLLDLQR